LHLAEFTRVIGLCAPGVDADAEHVVHPQVAGASEADAHRVPGADHRFLHRFWAEQPQLQQHVQLRAADVPLL